MKPIAITVEFNLTPDQIDDSLTQLQYLIEDGRVQSARCDVDPHGQRRHPDAEVNIPAQDHFHDDVDADFAVGLAPTRERCAAIEHVGPDEDDWPAVRERLTRRVDEKTRS